MRPRISLLGAAIYGAGFACILVASDVDLFTLPFWLLLVGILTIQLGSIIMTNSVKKDSE